MTEPSDPSGNGWGEENQPENSRSSISSLTEDDWEQSAEDILEESSHDKELGKQMSRDAIRTSRGEMSEEAFYEKYHSKVKAEFGVDNRPIQSRTNDE